LKTLLVTGGAGFIGSQFVRQRLAQGDRIINVDLLTYASNLSALHEFENYNSHIFVKGNIGDCELIEQLLFEYLPETIVHFAAESHVDRSIDNSTDFITTNIVGTHQLLVTSNKYWQNLSTELKKNFRFIHISTDEVFGSLGSTGTFCETTSYDPHSPYSASKAASDHLVRSWYHTFALPTIITNCTNNYGPYQFPEKLIPMLISAALNNQPLPIYGEGTNIRDWLYVDDHCSAIDKVISEGIPGETYCIGGKSERSNLEVALAICNSLDSLAPREDGKPHKNAIKFVPDRPGHDFRYAMDITKIQTKLGWEPIIKFEDGLHNTVRWYIHNQSWWKELRKKVYDGKRLGISLV